MFAARNLELCTKDCACLFVCPTGATDTEDGTIDAEKCIDGCRLCVDACPSAAIHLIYQRIPRRRLPQGELIEVLSRLLRSKAALFLRSRVRAENAKSKGTASFFAAMALSNQILGEDCVRESGYLVPEAQRMENLVHSGLIQRRYREAHEEVGAVDQVLDTIMAALREHRDAPGGAWFLCQACGQVMSGEKPAACPGCASDRIQGF